MTATVYYLTNDLLFSSRVSSLAKDAGIDLRIVRSRSMLSDPNGPQPRAVIIDLEHPDARSLEWVRDAAFAHKPPLLAYGPHVKEQLLSSAQAAGIDLVWSRGQFDKQIGDWFRRLASDTGSIQE